MVKKTWETPKEGLIGRSSYTIQKLVNDYDLMIDVCCTNENRVTQCPAFFSLDAGLDGLKQEWMMNCYMNPPYNDQKTWVAYAVSQVIKNKITVVALLRVDTCITYFRKYVMGIDDNNLPIDIGCSRYTSYIPGRVKYWMNGNALSPKDRPPFASCFVIFKPSVEKDE